MSKKIKICEYKDLREIGMRWVNRCCDCNELFLGIKCDFICGQCSEKDERNNETNGESNE